MTVFAETRDLPQGADHGHLVSKIAHIKALLEGYESGSPTAEPINDGQWGQPVDQLTEAFRLSAFERQLVWLAAAVELDREVAGLVAGILGDGDPRPTFSLALAILPEGHWDALAPNAALRYWRIIEFGTGPTLATRRLWIDERVLNYLAGIVGIDQRLDGVLDPDAHRGPLAPTQADIAADLARSISEIDAPTTVIISGDDVAARLGVARRAVEVLGGTPVTVSTAALPSPGPDLAGLVRLIDREAVLTGMLPILDETDGHGHLAGAFIGSSLAPVVFVIGEADQETSPRGRVTLRRAIERPSPSEQREIWLEAIPTAQVETYRSSIDEVTQHHRLEAETVYAIARELTAPPRDSGAVDRFRRLCRERTRLGLDGLAHRIVGAATWNDIVLPSSHRELLRDIARQVKHRTKVYGEWGFGEKTSRGLGITALFAGESGTGKTMAAEVLANDLELDLYRIDLAATVSKYIGETEKNLGRLFDAAEASGAVLLFDEADALFGKRGEVKDSHDRYANMEVSYLLQRMETYRGLAILTTNLRNNLDRAFVRRLRFIVQFPFPDEAHRAGIWRRAFPEETPLDGIDPDLLARMTIPGGSIWAIALSAAFAAAEDGGAVTPAHVLRAARVEYAKSDRVLTNAEMAGWS